MMKIPKKFCLLGYTIHVIQDPLFHSKHDLWGQLYVRQREIYLQAASAESLLSEGRVLEIFLHELTHAILFAMEHELRSDEAFVDLFSGLLYQALESFE